MKDDGGDPEEWRQVLAIALDLRTRVLDSGESAVRVRVRDLGAGRYRLTFSAEGREDAEMLIERQEPDE